MYGYYGYDTLFLAVIVVFILGIWAQIRVKNTYKKYSQEYASSGVTSFSLHSSISRLFRCSCSCPLTSPSMWSVCLL